MENGKRSVPSTAGGRPLEGEQAAGTGSTAYVSVDEVLCSQAAEDQQRSGARVRVVADSFQQRVRGQASVRQCEQGHDTWDTRDPHLRKLSQKDRRSEEHAKSEPSILQSVANFLTPSKAKTSKVSDVLRHVESEPIIVDKTNTKVSDVFGQVKSKTKENIIGDETSTKEVSDVLRQVESEPIIVDKTNTKKVSDVFEKAEFDAIENTIGDRMSTSDTGESNQ